MDDAAPASGAWQPPPGFADPPPVGGGSTFAPPPPAVLQQPAPAAPPIADAQWPDWLPRNEHSEAVVEDIPTRLDPSTTPAATPGTAPAPAPPVIQVAAAARSSSWVAQLYPASAALNANRRLVTYVGLGILGLIALYVLYQALVNAGLFTLNPGTATPDSGPTGTQFQQADGYLTNTLSPALAAVASAEKPIATDCGGTHSVTCRNTLENADSALVAAVRAIDQGTFPGCISTTLVQTRRDLVVQEQAVRAALIGFRSNTDDLVTRGLADYTAVAATVKTDAAALRATTQSTCPKTP